MRPDVANWEQDVTPPSLLARLTPRSAPSDWTTCTDNGSARGSNSQGWLFKHTYTPTWRKTLPLIVLACGSQYTACLLLHMGKMCADERWWRSNFPRILSYKQISRWQHAAKWRTRVRAAAAPDLDAKDFITPLYICWKKRLILITIICRDGKCSDLILNNMVFSMIYHEGTQPFPRHWKGSHTSSIQFALSLKEFFFGFF